MNGIVTIVESDQVKRLLARRIIAGLIGMVFKLSLSGIVTLNILSVSLWYYFKSLAIY